MRFPPENSCGELSVQEETLAPEAPVFSRGPFDGHWTSLGRAKGNVAVPAGMRVRLVASGTAALHLTNLARLRPGDLYGVSLSGKNVDDRSMALLSRQIGLRVLELSMTRVADAGLRQITNLKSLEALSIPAGATDAGLRAIAQNLPGLKALFFANSRVSNAGLRWLSGLRSLEALALGGAYVDDDALARLAGLNRLEYLRLAGPNFTGRGFGRLKDVPSLRVVVSFRNASVQDAGLEALAALPNLESLSLLDNGQVSDAGMAFLARSRSLRRLCIDKTQVTERGVADLMRNGSWEHLELPEGSVTDRVLALLGAQSRLEHLDLGRPAPRQPYTQKGLAELAGLSALKDLRLAGPGVTDAALKSVARLKTLKRLALGSCPVTDAGLARLTALQSLEILDLSGVRQVTPAGLSVLKVLPSLVQLGASQMDGRGAVLDLSGCARLRSLILHMDGGALGDESLATLKGLARLEVLQLPSTDITGAGLASLSGLTNLNGLVLCGPKVKDAELASLAAFKKLSFLWWTGSVTDAGVARLEALENLADLKIRSTQPISPGAVRRLKTAVPSLGEVQIERVPAALGEGVKVAALSE